MTVPTVNVNLTDIDLADSTTGWVGFQDAGGGTPSPSLEQDLFIQGSAAISAKISGNNQNEGFWFDHSSGIDMTVTGRHLFIWIAVTTVANMNAIADGGLYIKVGSSTTNWNKYFIGGVDFTSPDRGFIMYVMDLNKTPSEINGTIDLTSVTHFGAGLKQSGTSKAENLVVDAMRYGDGMQVEGGEPGVPITWERVFEYDDDLANKFGLIQKRANKYYLTAGLDIGDASGTETTLWDDESDSEVVFEDPRYHNGSILASSIDGDNLYSILLQGNGTGTTDIKWGSVVGTGDDRRGLFGGGISSDGPKWTFDAETDIADLDTVNLYGMKIQGAGICQFSGSTKTDVIGTSFVECDEVQFNDSEVLSSSIVSPVPQRGAEILSTHNMENVDFIAGPTADAPFDKVWQFDASGPSFLDLTQEAASPEDLTNQSADSAIQADDSVPSFVDETVDFASAAAGDVDPFPATEAVGDYFAIGFREKFSRLDINVSTAGIGGFADWEYWDGLAWTALSSVTDNTNDFKNSGTNSVTWTKPAPGDWKRRSVGGSPLLFFVRLVITTVYSTNPILTQGTVTNIGNGDVFLFPSTPATGDYAAFGSRRKFNKLAADLLNDGASGTNVWEYWDGDSWEALNFVIDTANLFNGASASTGDHTVTWENPSDWAATSLNGELSLFYVRLRTTTAPTLGATFHSCAAADFLEHSTHAPVPGTLTYDNFRFFGGAHADVENSVASTLEDSYAFSNRNGGALVDDQPKGYAQSFTGAGGKLVSARFWISKTLAGPPTGDITCKLYAHTGVFGTTSEPTGAALAISTRVLDITTLPRANDIDLPVGTSEIAVDFEFEDEFVLVSSTKYCIALEFDGGVANEGLVIAFDNSSPTHAGNAAFLNSNDTWQDNAALDLCFEVRTGTIVEVQNSNGADAITEHNTSQGATKIINTIVLKVTVSNENGDLLQAMRVRFEESAGTLISDGETNASGVFSFNYNFSGNTPANIVIRRKDFEDFENPLTITVAGFDIPITMQADLDVNLP